MKFTILTGILSISLTVNAGADWLEPNLISDETSVRNITLRAFSWSSSEKLQGSSVEPIWPIRDLNPTLLQRFGTPTLLENSTGQEFKVVDSHEALDIVRSSVAISEEVIAPIAGVATVIRQHDDYTTGIAILNRDTGLVFSLLHVVPAEIFKSGTLVEVKQGATIGKLAPVTTMRTAVREKYKHTHLLVADLTSGSLVNPLRFYRRVYQDSVPPVIEGATAERSANGLEVRLTAFDLDGRSPLPFELHSIGFEIQADEEVLLTVPRCYLETVNQQSGSMAKGLFDLDLMSRFNILESGDHGDYKSNAANPKKRFVYALDRIRNSSGSCAFVPEPLKAPAAAKNIVIRVSAWDLHGNRANQTFSMPLK